MGVSQKLAAQTLSNCAICPETGQYMMTDNDDDEEEYGDEEYS